MDLTGAGGNDRTIAFVANPAASRTMAVEIKAFLNGMVVSYGCSIGCKSFGFIIKVGDGW